MAKKEELNPERLQMLVHLVDELKKDQPDQKIIKRGMRKVGIKYAEDPIEVIENVLSELNSLSFKEG